MLLSCSSCVHLHLDDLFISWSNVPLPMCFLILPFGFQGGFTLQMNNGGIYWWIWNWAWGAVPGCLREWLSHTFKCYYRAPCSRNVLCLWDAAIQMWVLSCLFHITSSMSSLSKETCGSFRRIASWAPVAGVLSDSWSWGQGADDCKPLGCCFLTLHRLDDASQGQISFCSYLFAI